jgi:prepilin-type N-terminal cleavage/methylation domain-containing protein
MKKTGSSKLHTLKNTGFTLVELVVSMTLTAIFATAIVAIMPSATRIFMQVEDMSRAQVVADMVVDALRKECADTYIEDFASVRIVNAASNPNPADESVDLTDIEDVAGSSGDTLLLESLKNINSDSAASGNVLIIRKSVGYCEAIYSDIAISESNYNSVKDEDKAYKFENGISSRAVYRFFPDATTIAEEIRQGYVHFGYYQCGRKDRQVTDVTHSDKIISCIFPAIRYDYTAPFSSSAYNGYTVALYFSNLDYTLASGETVDDLYTRRPSSVQVTVNVYSCDYARQGSTDPIYTRTAILTFEEDTTE